MSSNQVVFVLDDYITPTYYKFALALNKAEIELIFVIEKRKENEYYIEKMMELGRVFYFNSKDELYNICQKFTPLAFHIFVNHYEYGAFLTQRKKDLGKIVITQYDPGYGIFRNYYKKGALHAVNQERIMLSNADGICSRYFFDASFYDDKEGFDIKGKWINFPYGCIENQKFMPKLSNNPNDLNLVFAGYMSSDPIFKTENDHILLEFAKKCDEHKVHLYAYPSYDSPYGYRNYHKFADKSDYFHMYPTKKWDELIVTLSMYDYGVQFSNEKTYQKYLTRESYEYGCENKYYDYIDADIPIISKASRIITEDFCREGVLINKNLMDVDFEELKEKKNDYKDALMRARSKYSIFNNIGMLIDFYRSL